MALAVLSSIGSMIGISLSFPAGNWLFSKISGKDADQERIRHNKALEKFTRDRNLWLKARQSQIDLENRQKQNEISAQQKEKELMSSMREYYLTTNKDISTNLNELPLEPKVSDYYQRPEGQGQLELILVGASAVAITYFVVKK